MKKRKVLVLSLVAAVLVLAAAAGGYWVWQQQKGGAENPVAEQKVRPEGTYKDLTANTPEDQGLVVDQNTDIASVDDMNDKLKAYFETQKSSGEKVQIRATYGEYAVGETDFVGTLWGPRDDGTIGPLAYSDIEVFSCKDLESANAPSDLAINLANGRTECLDTNGENREYKN